MSRIKEDDIDALRERADIVEIVSSYTTLKKSSGNTFKGLCPFHSEKTPSFTVDAAKGLYHCFGCGEGGNLYHFIGKLENLDFPEAVEWLARRVGFELRYEEQRSGDKGARGLKQRIVEANEEAAGFFHEHLMESPGAEEARKYLKSRGFDREVAVRWELGFAPGRNALYRHLVGKGFTLEELLKADLVRKSERDGSIYDSFRNRIIFPTRSHQGNVVGFGARQMPGDDHGPKYLNTSETPAFHKSRFMYGLDRARRTLGRGLPAIVVEGYTDVIAIHETGVHQAVATNGVALGETHFELLKKFTDRAVLMFDADEAGKGATERGFELQTKIGIDVLVALLPAGQDPADLVAENGEEGLKKAVDAAQPLMEFKLRHTIESLPMDTPEAKGRAVRAAVEVLGWHPDTVARHQYAFLAARLIGVDPEQVQRLMGERRGGFGSSSDGASDADRPRRLPGHVKVEREALQLLLKPGGSTPPWVEGVIGSDFTAPPRRELFDVAMKANGGPIDVDSLTPEARSLYTELAVADELDPTGYDDRCREIFTRLRVFSLERSIKDRRRTLQEVNPLVDAGKHDELFTELVGLEAARRDLLRRLQGVA